MERGDLTSDEFKAEFIAAREGYINRLKVVCSESDKFFASDGEGQPMDWVWNEETYRLSNSVGNLTEAISFARNMIDAGMGFACMVTDEGENWLHTWEYGCEKPDWPKGKVVVKEEIYLGITI